MSGRLQDRLLEPMFSPPEFDVDLCAEVVGCIVGKTNMDLERARDLSVLITTSIGFLCSSFEHGFIEEIDARIGNDSYGVRVFMSRHNRRAVDTEN